MITQINNSFGRRAALRALMMLWVAVIMAAASGCSFRFSYDRDLEAQWQLMEIVSPDGSVSEVTGRYYSFASRVVDLTSSSGALIGGNMVYDKENKLLTLNFPLEGHWLGYWGIEQSTPVTAVFEVEALDSHTLVLRKPDHTILKFRKF